jgi:hypothetical protein
MAVRPAMILCFDNASLNGGALTMQQNLQDDKTSLVSDNDESNVIDTEETEDTTKVQDDTATGDTAEVQDDTATGESEEQLTLKKPGDNKAPLDIDVPGKEIIYCDLNESAADLPPRLKPIE